MLTQELEKLQLMFAEMASLTENMLEKAVKSLVDRDESIALDVINVDEHRCNNLEIEIEAKAIEILTLYSPKASQMRKVIAIIKANGDLERVGDQAVNISQSSIYLITQPLLKPLIDIPRMADISIKMIRLSLDALLQENIEYTKEALVLEDTVDALNLQVIRELITFMISDPRTIERALKLIFISRSLERAGDLATNICEDAIYFMTGEDTRHPKDNKNR